MQKTQFSLNLFYYSHTNNNISTKQQIVNTYYFKKTHTQSTIFTQHTPGLKSMPAQKKYLFFCLNLDANKQTKIK